MTIEDLKDMALEEALKAAEEWKVAHHLGDVMKMTKYRAIIDAQIRWLAIFEELES